MRVPAHTVVLLLLLMWFLPTVSRAHKPSDSHLVLSHHGAALEGRWDLSLRDLEYALGLDHNFDGEITWGELKLRHDEIARYALARLGISRGGKSCTLASLGQLVDHHSDGAYTVLRFSLDCPRSHGPLRIDYRLFFDLDPSHRGRLRIDTESGSESAVLTAAERVVEVEPEGRGAWRQLADYGREGVWHIWIGFDHLLFLIALLLPAVLRREAGGWQPLSALRPALWNVFAVVSAFTVAHSITLALSALGLVHLPSRWVESAIALSVVLAALHNLWPVVRGHGARLAFGLGLVHGFGFASVLLDLGLPGGPLALALLGFNLGVEAGQIVVVVVFFLLAWQVRGTRFYRRGVLPVGSWLAAGIATLWLLERGLGLGA